MSQELATAWWKKQFGDEKDVSYEQMITKLKERFPDEAKFIPVIVPLLMDSGYNFRIKLEEFESFNKKFHDFTHAIPNCAKTFFENGQLCLWWHGKMSRDEAKVVVGKCNQPNSFLLRFSNQSDAFALAYNRVKDGSSEVKHVLIECTEKGYRIQGENVPPYQSITEFIKESEHTKHVIPFDHHISERLRLIAEEKYTKEAMDALHEEWKKQPDSKYVTVGQPTSKYVTVGEQPKADAPAAHSGYVTAGADAAGADAAAGSGSGGS